MTKALPSMRTEHVRRGSTGFTDVLEDYGAKNGKFGTRRSRQRRREDLEVGDAAHEPRDRARVHAVVVCNARGLACRGDDVHRHQLRLGGAVVRPRGIWRISRLPVQHLCDAVICMIEQDGMCAWAPAASARAMRCSRGGPVAGKAPWK